MAGMWRRLLLLSFVAAAVAAGAPRAAASPDDCHDCDDCGPCDSGCAPCGDAHGHSHGGAYGHGHYQPAYSYGRGHAVHRRTWSGYSVLRRSRPWAFAAYSDPCVACRPCSYRFYVGRSGYARALIRGWRHATGPYGAPLAWPGDVHRLSALELDVEDPARVPLVPLAGTLAHEAHYEGRYVDASAAFQADADADASDGDAWIGLAHAAFGLQEWERAARALRGAARAGALDPAARLDVEGAWRDPAAFEERLSALRVRVGFRVFDDDARLVLGWVEAGLGQTEDAKADLGAVLRRSPSDPAALALLGKTPPAAPLVAAAD